MNYIFKTNHQTINNNKTTKQQHCAESGRPRVVCEGLAHIGLKHIIMNIIMPRFASTAEQL